MSENDINIQDENDPLQDTGRDGATDQNRDAEQFDEVLSLDTAQVDPIEALLKERDELREKLLRSAADFQNFARRARLDIDIAREHRTRDIARDLLTVLDHFDHALQIDSNTTDTKSLLDGVTIVRDELNKTLARFDVQRMVVDVGQEFDPNQHEALMRQAVEGMESNRIAQELQPGYLHGEHTLRPAKVAVSE